MKKVTLGWLRAFLLALVTLSIVYGIKRNSGSFLQPFESLFHITRSDSSLLLSIWLLMWAVSFLIIGQLSQFIRFNKILLFGMLTTSLGLFMTAFSSSYTGVLIWFSIVSGLGFGTAWMVCFATSIYDVYDKRGLSTGINSSMQVGGAAIFLVGMRWMVEKMFGLSGTFIALAIMIAIAGIIGYFLASKEKSKVSWFRFDRRLTWFYISVAIVLGIWTMQLAHRLPLFKEVGINIAFLGILASIEFWINAGTEFMAGWFFIDKLKKSRFTWMIAVFGIVIGNLALVFLARGFIGFTFYAIILGGICILPVPIVPAVNYLADRNKEDWGPLMGTTLFFANIAMALFSWFGGVFYSWLGSYELILLITSGIALICAFILRK